MTQIVIWGTKTRVTRAMTLLQHQPDEAMDDWQDSPQRQHANGWNSQNGVGNGGSPNGFGAGGDTLSVASQPSVYI